MLQDLPDALLAELTENVVPVVRRVYDFNAGRHEPLSGDDGVVFGSAVYRNSWYQLEQAFKHLDGWTTSRPDGSLTLSNGHVRAHVYRAGQDEHIDLDAFRLADDPTSVTKRSIASVNTNQMVLALFDQTDEASTRLPTLSELAIVHAGNPDDGCCGIWVGAPIAVDESPAGSPWAWIRPLWLIDRPTPTATVSDLTGHVRHDEMELPDVDIRPADDDQADTANEA